MIQIKLDTSFFELKGISSIHIRKHYQYTCDLDGFFRSETKSPALSENETLSLSFIDLHKIPYQEVPELILDLKIYEDKVAFSEGGFCIAKSRLSDFEEEPILPDYSSFLFQAKLSYEYMLRVLQSNELAFNSTGFFIFDFRHLSFIGKEKPKILQNDLKGAASIRLRRPIPHIGEGHLYYDPKVGIVLKDNKSLYFVKEESL